MELHPILERGCMPNSGLWYVLSCVGDSPSERVGHTCSYVPASDGINGKVYFIGGANPSNTFNEVFVLDLYTFSWDTVDHPGLRARYEHAAFTAASQPDKIHVFGGADQGGNHNDIQTLDVTNETWSIVTANGNVPSPRTYHTNASIGDRFIVYSGGQSGSDPVGDRQVHGFDMISQTWNTVTIRGNPPKPRHGHVVVSVGNKVYVHGGMSGPTFYDDLHVLDLERNTWSAVKQKKVYPCARAAHCGVACGKDLYIFGGMNRNGPLDDLYKLDTTTMKWVQVELQGPPPAPRLDFAACVVRIRVAVGGDSAEDIMAPTAQAKEVLEQQLSRLGSAGSGRSMGSCGSPGSAGSQRSMCSLPPLGSPPPHSDGTLEMSAAQGAVGGAAESIVPDCVLEGGGMWRIVELLLLHGGMDTEGEIYDDCLVFLLNEYSDDSDDNEDTPRS